MIEKGVMVCKTIDGSLMGWGILYEDGRSRQDGWVQLEVAEIHDPRFCKKPTDVTWRGSHYVRELKAGHIMRVTRTTTVEVHYD